MKTLLVFLVIAFNVICVYANSHCRSNAILRWWIDSSAGGLDVGTAVIMSGKDSQTIPTVTAMNALSDCAFNNHGCTGLWKGTYWRIQCNSGGMKWRRGEGNVEFNCSDGPYTCYNFGSL
ncbi:hypothetical protein CU097_006155 [Rhizopus azygosporus]|uniref:Cyanovirin-N domain-containing protein n=1 Tax=Rhizopus azygosporus TaxID=86630 RepID=A0A367JU60_RHIAZ|nr:hypothetical protein CU097_006155 [Rhizopus azygosporus]